MSTISPDPPSDEPVAPATLETAENVSGPPDWDEELFLATSGLLVQQPQPDSLWLSLGCLLGSLLLFALSFLGSLGFQALALIIAVLFLHEAGHWLGMRLFGYRNVRMFFIPFFGAAVSGTKHAAPAWQQAVVLLLGPLPGILLGLALLLWLAPASGTWVGKAVLWLIIINGINLAPIVPLDGGRLMEVLLFARRPGLAVAFRLLAVVGLAIAAWKLSWIFGVIGLLLLVGTPDRYRRSRLERVFANNPSELPEDIEQLSDAQRRELFGWVRLLDPGDRTPTSLASEMRDLHEHMVMRRPGVFAWVLLMGLYLAGIGACLATPFLKG